MPLHSSLGDKSKTPSQKREIERERERERGRERLREKENNIWEICMKL